MRLFNRDLFKKLKSTTERTLPHFLVGTVGFTILLSWFMGPSASASGVMAAASGSASPSGSPTGSPTGTPVPTPTPTPVPPVYPTVPAKPSFPPSGTQNFYLRGNNASVELNISRGVGNRPPVASALLLKTSMNQSVSGTLSGSDPDGDSITFDISVNALHGHIDRSGANVTYVPNTNENFQGWDAFAYSVSDGHWKTGAVVTVQVGNPTGSAPEIRLADQTIPFHPQQPMSFSVNTSGGASLSMVVSDTHGSIVGAPESFTYDPGMYFGQDQFYVIADETSGSMPQRAVKVVTFQVADPNVTTRLYDGDPDAGAPQIGNSVSGYGNVTVTNINTLAMADGVHALYAKITDDSGLSAKGSVDFTIDNTPPDIAWYQQPSQTYISNKITLGVTASDKISLQAVKMVVVDSQNHSTPYTVQSSCLGQSCNYFINTDFSVLGLAGSTKFYFYAVDNAGNSSSVAPQSCVVDNDAPTVKLFKLDANGNPVEINPSGAPVAVSGSVTLQMTGSDSVSGLQQLKAFFGNEPLPRVSGTAASQSYPWDTTKELNGSFSIVVHGLDNAGNEIVQPFANFVISNFSAPVAKAQSVPMNENTTKSITLSADNVDANATYSIQTGPVNGTLSAPTGTPPSVNYQPAPGFNGTDSFTFTVSDRGLDSTARVDITIAGQNDAPSAAPITTSVGLDSTVYIYPSGSDPEKSAVTFEPTTQPSNGTLNTARIPWRYTPNNNYAGPDGFQYRSFDGTLYSVPASVSISVVGTPVNFPPTATSKSVSTTQGNSVSFQLEGNDPEGKPVTYSITGQPNKGTLSGQGADWTYTPTDPLYTGSDSLTYVVSDGVNNSPTATVSITVSPTSTPVTNNPPSAVSMPITAVSGVPTSFSFMGSDPEGQPVTYHPNGGPSHGTMVVNGANVTYTSNAGYTGPDSISYTTSDGVNSSLTATVSITVNSAPVPSVNNPPTAESPTLAMAMGNSLAVTLVGHDPEGQPLTYKVSVNPSHGTLSGSEPNLIYKPAATFKGTDAFQFTVSDGVNPPVSGLVTISVADLIPPTLTFAAPAANATVSGTISVTANATDNDNIQSVQISLDGNLLTSLAAAPFTYSLNTAGLSGTHTLTLAATDPSGNTTQVTENISVAASAGPAAPTIQLTNPLSAQIVNGVIQILALTTNDVTSAQVVIGANTIPLSMTSAGHFSAMWDTKSSKNLDGTLKYPDGSYVLDAKVVGSGGTGESVVNVTVDNTAPTLSWVLPTPSTLASALLGTQTFEVNAQDANGIDHVEFWFGTQKFIVLAGVGSNYSYLFDTRNYPDFAQSGITYTMQAVAVDRAGNTYTSGMISFTIDNANAPPSSTKIKPITPPDGSYVTTDAESAISAVIPGGIQTPVTANTLKVFALQNGNSQQLTGAITYANNTLGFVGAIPANAQITWAINALDSANQALNAQFGFTRMMSKDVGGTAYLNQGQQSQFQVTVPAGSLKQDMFVAIDLVDPNTLAAAQPSSPGSLAEGQRQIAGPFKVYGRNATNSEITDLAHSINLSYNEFQNPLQPDELSRAIQIQVLDGNVWRPVGTGGVPQASSVNGKAGARAVTAQVSAFGTFRVNSVPVAASGIDGVFCYPSPFSPHEGGTSIQYSLSSAMVAAQADVTIVIYDLFGNLVRTMHYSPGENGAILSNTVPWDGRNGRGDEVANGGYILQIVAKDSSGNTSKAKYKVGVVK